jgi:2-dehydropantoate 2-reductase
VAKASGAELDAEKLIAAVNVLPAPMRSSMQKDAEAGRAPELDAIAGPILRGAAQHGLPATATEELVAAIKKKIAQ